MTTDSSADSTAVPQRTCVGCKAQDAQTQLLRIVRALGTGGFTAVVPDPKRRMPGRGAWLHPHPDCLALALKRKAFNRAFSAPVDASAVEGYLAATPEQVASKASNTSNN
ncbi:MAG: YlxR family protein [Acidobacteria bacterium]|nr:YlxR family protein [Acidobacteriota bacterium]